jgi:hypothetical protein
MVKHAAGLPREEKRDDWKSESYTVDQTRRLKAANRKKEQE